ncbi:bifunctional 2-methylcitrate dehydratase/aconitate hydratase [Pseudomonas sp. FW306-02-F02-AA]|uniref:2-methylcitrate dehydratase n=1 Tax=Pseudomonas fluorescens TaxID=294 RepID=A0A0N7H0W5_PSEFL|nr:MULTISPECIES: MmgE/PrpD family protein [Pseudomonas]ALI04276.1 2-methylcitrate dehydratase [Pseudomonas fluorescens]PMZ02477.1 bifunctional 2-methylcitrate dehydratase/aconitate hydratase [Pseudomonas sp. FW306-02-F02-AB]PMZ10082.1 bifunctional 2-methylcitrate dehydratase/aconitate hydratase [Pseudomonas sp. FW306-02-H06C]PMZ14204.1 bifunctional 2-methylcitrate dehydratase/aconitate hydratase [Pseudomonas sp. FW306-02-F02-AA]PMZ20382.1 bifunctional 2-methylcitrate dehydratase/aconitate hydr
MSERLQRLAQFCVETRFDDLPPALVAQAKRHILDTVGATLAGAASEIAVAVRHTFANENGKTLVWGTAQQVGAAQAAMLNGIAAHALELDDTGGCDHSGAVVLPAVMAAVSLSPTPVNGRELITAVVIGYEIGRRVLEACGGYSAHNGAGWHSTATCGVFGAAAASARILGLDPAQTLAALGIAGSFSGGLWAFIHDGSHSKKLHSGRAAEGGLLAARFAEQGISGPTKLFDDVWGGFLKTLATEHAQPEALDADLGVVWKLARCSIKPYASCRGTHSAIDALGLLLEQLQIDADQLEDVQVSLCGFLNEMCGGRDIGSLAAAQMSLPYALAARLVHGHCRLEAYDDEQRSTSEIAHWMSRIHLEVDPQLSEDGEPIVSIRSRDGRTASLCVEVPLGAPGNPLSDAALEEKFLSLATRVLPVEQATGLLERLWQLEKLQSVGTLIEIIE